MMADDGVRVGFHHHHQQPPFDVEAVEDLPYRSATYHATAAVNQSSSSPIHPPICAWVHLQCSGHQSGHHDQDGDPPLLRPKALQ
jgi:hypothetical protein